ncbi:MAG: GNAT family N-acetyltransferase [Actinomycetota bacterium]|nr:GNAT family N-acetyltransferase [Actinomycetota bacterium]
MPTPRGDAGRRRYRAGVIRPARPADVPTLVELVRALATYEQAAGEVRLDEPALEGALFATPAHAAAHVAEVGGAVVGMAIWFRTFSTWTGRHGIWLEDLYVQPDHRRRGLGRALVAALAAQARAEGAARLDWAVLDGNEPARQFYAALGATTLEAWRINRVAGDPLDRLAHEAAGA